MKLSIDYTALQGDIDKIYNKNCFYYFSLSMIGSFDRSFCSLSFCEVSGSKVLQNHILLTELFFLAGCLFGTMDRNFFANQSCHAGKCQ